nr:ribonuclease H protein [Tanacetum cinerariifolium]
MATNGSHASWLWKILLLGRDLLLRGVRWQVGKESNIYFWTQKWIPYPDDYYVQHPRGPFSLNVLVYDFINNGEWVVSKLNDAHDRYGRVRMEKSLILSAFSTAYDIICQFNALGVIARDSTGSILLCSGKIWCVSGPLMAEILAIRSACHLAISQGWQNAIIESDFKLPVSFASSEADPPWAVAAIIDDIKLWASQLALSFSWVYHDCNLAAHHVTKVAFSSHVKFVWDVTFPVEITSIARS